MASSDETEATTSVHTEPGAPDGREAWDPFRVARNNPQVEAYREWWRNNPLNNLRSGPKANLWRRFQAEVVEGKTPLEASQGPHTMTLEDLKMPIIKTEDLDELLGPETEVPSDELWWGTPDPAVYAQGTMHLNKKQLAEECEKGNLVTLRRFREMLGAAEDWEIEEMQRLLSVFEARQKMVMPTGDGKAISFYDLYHYVHNNPQLKALAKRGVNAVDAADGMTREERLQLLEEVAPWTLNPEAETMQLPEGALRALPLGLLSDSAYYSRPPTRWLKGLDGRKDFGYGVYLHEARAAEVLGPKGGGRGAEGVLASNDYFEDLLAAGPLVGMTLMAVASRPLPLEEATSAWSDRLAAHLERLASSGAAGPSDAPPPRPCCSKAAAAAALAVAGRGGGGGAIPRPVFGPIEESREKLRALTALFEPSQLAAQTRLLDGDGKCLREGASLLLSAAPGGVVMVEAITPGKVRDQEAYLLGAVADARLCAALFGMFLHPDACLDRGFAHRAAYNSLWFVNGFKSYNADNNPNVRLASDPAPRVHRLARRGRGAAWRLPPPGQDPTAAAPELVGSVKQRVAAYQIHGAFAAAWEAVDAVERRPGMSTRAFVEARRRAAEGALTRSLGALGLNVQGLSIPMPELPEEEEPPRPPAAAADLAAMAAPLEVP
ncbi:hypothetical protein Rsub_01813 [Raphidocelis subcapitata]|uniref:Uncharacterized protein n=1 Tax=Raphidocelis subcapitata TaxID=307507 RepID=A0A2V0NNG5_9CHLO|nr:hypothetical protein Rsub_01813 [Raphidocelis subcapitata]|eukprot:GBF89096.1 hypothetical protein Rsub_01813 [Raphidocelis subcapitata]